MTNNLNNILLRLSSTVVFCTIVGHAAIADCPADPKWLPQTPAPTFDRPPPHPAPDCVFYKPAWHNFLFAAQPVNGNPAFLSYPMIGDVFGPAIASKFAAKRLNLLAVAPRALKGSNNFTADAMRFPGPSTPGSINAGVRQAGFAGLLIDQSGQPIFYAIHMNQTFVDFVRAKKLTTKAEIESADPNLELPTGAVELKSAWRVVPKGSIPSNYITVTEASVPTLKRNGQHLEIDESAPPRTETVALLALHVVFRPEGHPEFVWATFEHVNENGVRDLAPAAAAQPSVDNGLPGGVDGPISTQDFTLYKNGTLASVANHFLKDDAMVASFDEKSQTFLSGGKPVETSVYRLFAGSKSVGMGTGEDGDVTDLNTSMTSLFAQSAPNDPRRNYRLVGAIWMDKPQLLTVDMPIVNPADMDTDDPAAIVAGEDGLSSMAMESFTQNSFVNCFSCHDTQAVTDSNANVVLNAKKLNVSHIFSKFVIDSK
ncbi:hypothetical protein [Bradyrhizobium iriomotense]|uniref:Cytochrome c domain-containing protein n=1 Tax=Bradyrhizobium iriomotense TaxID=441950 RepID=A0ABQ6B7M0_9BRAD|nr:hypothetical protein [Bradyrhizobium iriomotense]GLR90380.1 hypothetical protein GCM10007857_70950 [Bradyrhizobium iriomotense]